MPLGLFFPFFTGRRCILCQSMVYWYQPQPPGRACAAGIKKGGIPLRKAFSITGLVLGIAAAAASAVAIVFSSIGLHRQ